MTTETIPLGVEGFPIEGVHTVHQTRDLAVAATLAPLLRQPNGAELVLREIRDHVHPVFLLPGDEPKWEDR